jgi:beta-glucosidase
MEAQEGKREGEEVVQLYAAPRVASVDSPVKRLKAFQKGDPQPGETRTIGFTLRMPDFTLVDSEGRNMFVPGKWHLMVGTENDSLKVMERTKQ